jgi:hypothetical protein
MNLKLMHTSMSFQIAFAAELQATLRTRKSRSIMSFLVLKPVISATELFATVVANEGMSTTAREPLNLPVNIWRSSGSGRQRELLQGTQRSKQAWQQGFFPELTVFNWHLDRILHHDLLRTPTFP